jgi:glycosyltransferase involved in cell wall biosynthesis
MHKKKILFMSNYHRRFTGFGKNLKNILTHLYKTGKYEIVEAANGVVYGHAENEQVAPWKVIGTLPNNPARLQQLNQDPTLAQKASYGHEMIDKIIEEERPDIFVGIEDYWAFSGFTQKPWWNKINCMIWTTLDSIPIFKEAASSAKDVKYFFSWASFGSEELQKLGHSHVKHLRGSISNSEYYKLEEGSVNAIKTKFKINDNFIIGFVFRNQLRKTVSSLLDALQLIISEQKHENLKLLLHTNWKEGWDIQALMAERNIPAERVLTTYICSKCKDYSINPFVGHDINCPACGAEKSVNTVNISDGVFDYQLNEIYNIMDMYVHPFTSGGQEIPIQEAMLTETPIACTNYSCGTDFCNKESGGIPLSWFEFVEFPTRFKKASTDPASIVEAINTVMSWSPEAYSKRGKQSREYILNNYSIEVIGPQLEDIFDEMPNHSYDFNFNKFKMNPFYDPPPNVDDSTFVKLLYSNIIKTEVTDTDEGYLHWIQRLQSDLQRPGVLNYFKNVAMSHNNEIDQKNFDFESFLDKDDEGRRIAIVLKNDPAACLISTYFLEDMVETYPNHNIYLFTEAPPHLFMGNKFIHKILPLYPCVNDIAFLEGGPNNKRFFEVAYMPHLEVSMLQHYAHNDSDKASLCTK